MEIGVFVHFRPDTDLDQEFANLRKHNFSSCQLGSWHP